MKPARPLTATLFDDLADPIWGEGLPAREFERVTAPPPRGTTVVQPLDAIVGTNGDDTLVGTAGDDSIDGLKGADQMSGGTGNDSYVVDNAGDLVLELAGEGTDTVSASRNYTLTDHVENLILTGKAKTGTGNALDNQITGNDKANVLDGGAGADTLAGGLGNDSYTVDNAGDVLIEAAGGGTDSVKSSISYTLGAELENLSLSGSAGLSGTGNGLNNSLIGNKGANTLDGGAGNDSLDGGLGADTLIGGSGNDSYTVDNLGDVITELAGGGKDTVNASISYLLGAELDNLVLTGVANLQGTGNGLANRLTGNEGDNLLDGGSGADTLAGGLGNDSYLVDDAADVLTELAGGGTDSVSSSVSYTLAAELENLTLTGVAALDGTGNALANLITGQDGDNRLDGGAGADTLDGGAGNDLYLIDDAGDVLIEAAGGGTDTVSSSVSHLLAAEFENLTLTGAAALSGTGNALANVLLGNSGNNTLSGAAGNDTLDGGLGADSLVGGANADTYVVDDAGDVVVEAGGGGNDTVQASISHVLANQVENLLLTGGAHLSGTGNGLNNSLTGNIGDNLLDGLAGNDTMAGGAGNDSYVVDAAGDQVSESAGNGTDLVIASVSYTLGGQLENLTLTGTADLLGTGNGLDNLIVGNAGNNTLVGAGGNDSFDARLGVDSVQGDGGNDTALVAKGSFDGGTGSDTASIDAVDDTDGNGFGWYLNGFYVSAASSLAGIASALSAGGSYLLHNNLSGVQLTLSNVENLNFLSGSAGNDLAFALGSGSTFNGGGGTDTFFADWSGVSGKITWDGDSGNGATTTGFEHYLLITGAGNDQLGRITTSDYTEFSTGSGNDTANVSLGSYDGGSGSDTADIEAADTTGGNGFGWYLNGYYVSAGSSLGSVNSALALGGTYQLHNNLSGVQLTLSNVENLNFLAGSAGNDLVFALGTGTTYRGAGGIDTFYADWSASSADIAWDGDSGNGVTTSNFERFLLLSGSGNDVFAQLDNTGYAELSTGGGNDVATMNAGSIDGGSGLDTVNIDTADTTGGNGFGWYVNGYYQSASASRLDLAAVLSLGNAYALHNNLSGVQLTLNNVERLNVLSGSAGNDLVFALGTDTTYAGGAGTDTFYVDWSTSTAAITWTGSAGNSVVTTDFERFLLTFGSGDDTAAITRGDYEGGAGVDTANIVSLQGASGVTSYWYINGYYSDVNTSRLDLAGRLALGSNLAAQDGTNGNATFVLSGFERLNLLAGSDSNDLVFALGSGTTYAGGAGTDTFYADWSTSSAAITWTGSAGNSVVTTDFERFLLTFGSGDDTAAITRGDYEGGAGVDTANIVSLQGASGVTSYWYINGYYSDVNTSRLDLAGRLALGSNLAAQDGTNGNATFVLNGFERLNLLAGSDSNDLVFALGGGTTYAGGAGTDTFYADWSATATAITWTGSTGNGVTATDFERFLITLGTSDDTAAVSRGDYEGGAGTDTANIASLQGSSGNTSYWYINGYYSDGNTSRLDLAGRLALDSNLVAFDGVSSGATFALNGFERLNLLAGSDSNDLVFALGGGTTYAGGAGSDTFYADWSTSSQGITWTGSSGNGLTATGFERFLLTFGSGNDSAAISVGDYEGGDGQDTANIATLQGSSGSTSYWYLNGWYADANSSRNDLANLLAIGTQYEARAGGSGELSFALNGFETLNLLAGGHSNDLVFARGGGTVYAGGAGTDTFYADWSSATSAISWINNPAGPAQTVNGALLSGLERLLVSTGSGNDLIDNSASAVGATNDDISTGAGADTLNGGAGADQMTGGNGNDTYFVDVIGDLVFESSGAGTGTDTVRSSIGYTLGDNLEKLQLLGNGAIDGFGNALANTLSGNNGNNALQGQDGNDTLAGGAGADTLTGGSGADTFQIDSLSAADLFADFSSGLDKLLVSQAAVAVGDGDSVVEGGTTVAGPGGFAASAELVIVTANIAGSIDANSAAAAIGNANSAYAVGQKVLFAVDNGSESQLWLFTAADANATVSAAELSLLTILSGTASTNLADYQFGP